MKNNYLSASATDVKNKFGDYLHNVLTKHEPVLVEKHGKPVAVIIEYSEWRKKESSPTPPSWFEELRHHANSLKKASPRAKKFSAVDLVRQVRDEEDK